MDVKTLIYTAISVYTKYMPYARYDADNFLTLYVRVPRNRWQPIGHLDPFDGRITLDREIKKAFEETAEYDSEMYKFVPKTQKITRGYFWRKGAKKGTFWRVYDAKRNERSITTIWNVLRKRASASATQR